jgi:hypothetical protein
MPLSLKMPEYHGQVSFKAKKPTEIKKIRSGQNVTAATGWTK